MLGLDMYLTLKRADDLLSIEEVDPSDQFPPVLKDQNSIEIQDLINCWDEQEASKLKGETEEDNSQVLELNQSFLRVKSLEIAKGSLVAIIGKVGSGKSSFLFSLLGEMPVI
mmetsp:Transcript_3480/g.3043  ORF Transcript_3480/g.3043 Transcript_3480/m.3043 type:complete len:112 (+) Transcript_3480:1132-1467(+)